MESGLLPSGPALAWQVEDDCLGACIDACDSRLYHQGTVPVRLI
jgi:hypothetical protein